MKNNYLDALIGIAFLAVAGFVVYGYFGESVDPVWTVPVLTDERYTYVSDTGTLVVSSHEGRFTSRRQLLDPKELKALPNTLGQWDGQDRDHSDPHVTSLKKYENKSGRRLYLLTVNATHAAAFHAAEVCYFNAGFKLLFADERQMSVAGQTFDLRRLAYQKGSSRQLVYYLYLWPDVRRDMRGGCSLIRVSVILNEDMSIDDGENLAADFFEELTGRPESDDISGTLEVLPDSREGRSIAWLIGNQVPNDRVPDPVATRRGLVLSYDLKPGDEAYKYIYSRSAIYDNALAVIALDLWDRPNEAARIVDTVLPLIEKNPRLWFAYNTHNSFPDPNDNDGMFERCGASGWMGYALLFHIRCAQHRDPKVLENDERLKTILSAACKMADAMGEYRVTEEGDPRRGLFRGGRHSYQLQLNKDKNKVVEKFVEQEITWCSIEHNIDLYFFYRDLSRLGADSKYKSWADELGRALMSSCWNNTHNQFNRGQRPEGPDPVLALDCGSWGGMLCLALNEPAKARACRAALEPYFATDNSTRGYKPYVDALVYETYVIGEFFYPEKPKTTWADLNCVWSEGSFGAALLMSRLGEVGAARDVMRDLSPMLDAQGGWQYNTLEIPHQFSNAPSVAGTAWALIVAKELQDPERGQLFWSP